MRKWSAHIAVERAIVPQYVRGGRVIRATTADGALDTTHFDAAYSAETQLVGLGVVEQTAECAVRTAEIAANLAMCEQSPHTSVDSNSSR